MRHHRLPSRFVQLAALGCVGAVAGSCHEQRIVRPPLSFPPALPSAAEKTSWRAEWSQPRGWVAAARSQPHRSWPVVSPFSGYVKQVFFQEGQAVQAGQILVKLDADWHLASRQLARGFIYSPATGIITARRVGSGRAVQRGQPVAVLQDWSVVHLRVPVSLAQAQTLTGHDTVQVYLAELPAQRFAGTVLRVDYAAPCPTLLVQVPNRSRARITAPMQAYVQLPPLPLLSNN